MLRIRSIASITLALLGAGACVAGELDRTVLAMGTSLRLRVEGTDPARLAAATEAALLEVERIEAACSTWRPESIWSALNRAEGRPVPMEPEWLALLENTKAWSVRTGGAFDPALMPLLEAWDLRGRGRTPSSPELVLARRASGARHLLLDPVAGTAKLEHLDAGVEEGGFLKGYALDRAVLRVKERGVETGLFDFGGQLAAVGETTVAIATPGDRQLPRLSLRLRNASLSTSGTSERGRHILDPRTGRPSPAWGSASVVMPSALEADLLSTALYVMGPTRGLRWARRRHLPACFLLNDGRVRMTREFRGLLTTKESI